MSSKGRFDMIECDEMISKSGTHIMAKSEVKIGEISRTATYADMNINKLDVLTSNSTNNLYKEQKVISDVKITKSSFRGVNLKNGLERQPLGTLCFDKNKRVELIGGSGSEIYKSLDGIYWNSSRQSGGGSSNTNLKSIEYDGVKYVGVGRDFGTLETDDILYSYNGYEWKVGTGGQDYVHGSAMYNGQIWVCLKHKAGKIMTSYDGYNWDERTIPSGSSITKNGIIWDGSKWIIGIYNNATSPLHISYNGIDWISTGLSIPASNVGPNTTNSTKRVLGYNGERYVTTEIGGNVLYSDDGLTWSYGNMEDYNAGGGYELDHNGSYWLAYMYNLSGEYSLYKSPDGVNWNVYDEDDDSYQGICWIGDKWVAGSFGTPGMRYSYDGSKWYDSKGDIGASERIDDLCITTNLVNKIEYPPNRTYICGEGSKVYFSDDKGRNWIAANTAPGGTRIISINRGDNLLLCCGDGGISYSENWGYDWTDIGFQVFNTNVQHICYGDNIWVGTGLGSMIGYSYDGVTWFSGTGSIFSTRGRMSGYNGKIWVSVGEDSTKGIRYSLDGKDWSEPSTYPFTNTNFWSIVWTKTFWIAGVVSPVADEYGISPDGKTWLKLTTPWSSSGHSVFGYNPTNGRIFGTASSLTAGYYSDDGINWVQSSGDSGNVGRSIIHNGEFWIMPRISSSELSKSNDAHSWILTGGLALNSNALGTATNEADKPYIDIQHPTICFGESIEGYTMAISPDGMKWDPLGAAVFTTRANKGLWNGTQWVAVGEGTNTIAYSENGVSWTGIGTLIFSTAGRDLLWDGSHWYAVGEGTNTLAYSSDGITWIGLGTPASTTNLQGITWNRSIYVVCGTDGSNTLFSSTTPQDSTSWSAGTGTQITTLGYDVKYFGPGSRFVAVGTGTNKAVYSDNGTSWTALTGSNFPNTAFRSIAYNRVRCILVGDNTGGGNNIGHLAIGATSITTIGSITPTILRGVCWNKKRFVAVGDTSSYVHSHDGLTWYNTPDSGSLFSTAINGVCGNSELGPVVVESALHVDKGDNLLFTNRLLFRDVSIAEISEKPFVGGRFTWSGSYSISGGGSDKKLFTSDPSGTKTVQFAKGVIISTSGSSTGEFLITHSGIYHVTVIVSYASSDIDDRHFAEIFMNPRTGTFSSVSSSWTASSGAVGGTSRMQVKTSLQLELLNNYEVCAGGFVDVSTSVDGVEMSAYLIRKL